MPVITFKKQVIVSVGPCRWFSAGQGIVAKVLGDDGTFLSVSTREGGLVLPKDAVDVNLDPETIDSPPEICESCGKVHPEPAVWQVGGELVCNLCYAMFWHSYFKRFELDPTNECWVKTFEGAL